DTQQRRVARFRRAVSAALVTLVVIATATAALAWNQRQTAIDRQRQAVSRDLLSQAELRRNIDPRGALQRAVAAYRITPTIEHEATTSIVNTFIATGYAGSLVAHQDSVRAAAFASDGRTLATASGDGMVVLWDVADRQAPRQLGQ